MVPAVVWLPSDAFPFFWMFFFLECTCFYCFLLSGLTSKDDEAVLLLWVALVQTDLLVRAGEQAEGWWAGGAGLAPPSVGRPPPQAEASAKAGWRQENLTLKLDSTEISAAVVPHPGKRHYWHQRTDHLKLRNSVSSTSSRFWIGDVIKQEHTCMNVVQLCRKKKEKKKESFYFCRPEAHTLNSYFWSKKVLEDAEQVHPQQCYLHRQTGVGVAYLQLSACCPFGSDLPLRDDKSDRTSMWKNPFRTQPSLFQHQYL